MTLRLSRIEKISGLNIDMTQIERILSSLEYKILEKADTHLSVEVPPFRTDVEVEDDLVADILRINSYAKIPLNPIQANPPEEITPQTYVFEDRLRDIMLSLGGHEHITDPLVKAQAEDPAQIVLENSISSDKNALRTTVSETLSKVVPHYFKHKINSVLVFEIGKRYQKAENEYLETRMLETIYEDMTTDLVAKSQQIKDVLASLLRDLGIEDYVLVKSEETGKAQILVASEVVGELGLQSFGLEVEKLMGHSQKVAKRATTKLPNVSTMDITYELSTDELEQGFGPKLEKIKKNQAILDAQVTSQYLTDKGKNITVTITYSGSDPEELAKQLK